jgi:probable F420-dependent oxidoreductase
MLGLGSQIRSHVERRYSMPWSQPAARMREYIQALRTIWDCWEGGVQLDFQGKFYTHTLMTPMFNPGPVKQKPPPILLAAVGPHMTRIAGEIADGILLHGFTTIRYVSEVTMPIIREALVSQRRDIDKFQVRYSPFIVAEADEKRRARAVDQVREQIAFYASTPAYRGVLDIHGWGDLQPELTRLSKQGRWKYMATLIDDEMLDAFAIVTDPESLVDKLLHRAAGIASRVLLALPDDVDQDWHQDVVRRLRAA